MKIKLLNASEESIINYNNYRCKNSLLILYAIVYNNLYFCIFIYLNKAISLLIYFGYVVFSIDDIRNKKLYISIMRETFS